MNDIYLLILLCCFFTFLGKIIGCKHNFKIIGHSYSTSYDWTTLILKCEKCGKIKTQDFEGKIQLKEY